MPASDRGAQQEALPPQNSHDQKRIRIAVRSKGKILLLDAGELIAVEAHGSYVSLRLQSSSHLIRGSISMMAEKLRPHGFVRIHRSVLVNTSHAEDVRATSSGEYNLRMRSGKIYTVTRHYRQNLRLLAELWIGSEP